MIIVVPMAGRGSRYADVGVTTPKPLVPVAGRPMVLWAMDGLIDLPISMIIFVGLREHQEQFDFISLLRSYGRFPMEFILLDDVTEGQLCTVLKAVEYLDSNDELLIAASDTYIRSSIGNDIRLKRKACRGLISVAALPGDRWSFARADDSGQVVEVAEKVRISDFASTGMYHFTSSREFVTHGLEIVHRAEKTLGEYYVIPVYQKMIDAGKWIGISKAHEMWDMGTPESKLSFEKHVGFIK